MDLKVRTTSFGGMSYRHFKTSRGFDHATTKTLDLAKFDFAAVFTGRKIPSGTILGPVTASGKLGAYDNDNVDGTGVALCMLADDVSIGNILDSGVAAASVTGDAVVAVLWHGDIIEALLPANSGVDANAKTDLGSRFLWF